MEIRPILLCCRLLCTGIIPFAFLSCLNIRIWRRMRQNSSSAVRSKSATSKRAGNLAAILIVIGQFNQIIFLFTCRLRGKRKKFRIAKMSNQHFSLFLCDQGKNVELEKIITVQHFCSKIKERKKCLTLNLKRKNVEFYI